MKPKYVKMYIQYRDTCNFKNGDFYYWSNKKEHDEEFLEEKLMKLIEQESVIPNYYNLPNITPFSVANEFLPNNTDYDHPFIEVSDIEFLEETRIQGNEIYGDIDEVLEAIVNPTILKKRIKQSKEYAKTVILDILKNLEEDENN